MAIGTSARVVTPQRGVRRVQTSLRRRRRSRVAHDPTTITARVRRPRPLPTPDPPRDDEPVSPDFTPPHLDLTFMTPLSEERASRLVAFLADGNPGTVLDIGCGWAELLLRVLERAPDAIGEGVDLDAVAIARGQTLADARGLTDRVDLRVSDARDLQGGWDRVICIGASQVWGPPVEELQPLPYAAALAALRSLVPRGGRVIYGDGIWSRPPTRAAIAPLAGRDDEFRPLGEVAELARRRASRRWPCTRRRWTSGTSSSPGYAAGYARWLAEHDTDDPEADEVRELAERQRAAYFPATAASSASGTSSCWRSSSIAGPTPCNLPRVSRSSPPPPGFPPLPLLHRGFPPPPWFPRWTDRPAPR